MMVRGFAIALLGFAVSMAAGPMPGHAAVRVCKGPVTSAVFTDESEKAGKTRALADWKAKVALLGERYTSWRLAIDKRLTCTLVENKFHACVAHGRPCTIKQVPPIPRLGPKPDPA